MSLQVLLRIVGDASSARRALDQTNQGARRLAGSARQAATAARLLGTAVAGFSAAAAGRQIVQASMQMQALERTFLAATGSAEAAANEIAFVRGEADRLGLSLPQTARSFAQFAAAAKGTAIEGADARDVFTAIAEAMTVLGRNSFETERALTAVQQMVSKGTVSAEELRQQLGDVLPGAFQDAARAMNVTTQELNKLLEAGAVDADTFLPRFAEVIRERFAGGVAAATDSAQAELNRMRTAIFETAVAIGEGGLLDAVAEQVEGLAEALSAPRTIQAATQLGELAGVGLRTAGEAAAFFARNLNLILIPAGALVAINVAGAGLRTATAIQAAAAATAVYDINTRRLNVALTAQAALSRTNPLLLVAGAAAAAYLAYRELTRGSREQAQETRDLTQALIDEARARREVAEATGQQVDAAEAQRIEALQAQRDQAAAVVEGLRAQLDRAARDLEATQGFMARTIADMSQPGAFRPALEESLANLDEQLAQSNGRLLDLGAALTEAEQRLGLAEGTLRRAVGGFASAEDGADGLADSVAGTAGAVDDLSSAFEQLRRSMIAEADWAREGRFLDQQVEALAGGLEEYERVVRAQDAFEAAAAEYAQRYPRQALSLQGDFVDPAFVELLREAQARQEAEAAIADRLSGLRDRGRGGAAAGGGLGDTIAEIDAEIAALERLAAAHLEGEAAVERATAAEAAAQAARRAGVALDSEAGRVLVDRVLRLEAARAAEVAAEEAARAHAGAIPAINQAYRETLPIYDRLVAAADEWRRTQMEALNPDLEGFEQAAQRVEDIYRVRIADAADQALGASTDWQDGLIRGLRDVGDGAEDLASIMERGVKRGADQAADALVQLQTTGTLAFDNLFESVVQGLLKVANQKLIIDPILGGFGKILDGFNLGDIFGNLFGGGSSVPAGTPAPVGAVEFLGPVAHAGWTVGGGAPPALRPVSPGLFASAGRFHRGGLADDEVPVIAQRGEGIFTPEQMATAGGLLMTAVGGLAKAAAGGGAGPISITLVNRTQSAARAEVRRQQRRSDGSIEIEVLIDEVDQRLAERVQGGRSQLGGVLEARGLGPEGGLYG